MGAIEHQELESHHLRGLTLTRAMEIHYTFYTLLMTARHVTFAASHRECVKAREV